MSTTRLLLRSAVYKPQHFEASSLSRSRRPNNFKKASSSVIMRCSDKLVCRAESDHRRKLKPPTSVAAPESAAITVVVDHPWATELASNMIANIIKHHAPLPITNCQNLAWPNKLHIQMLVEKTILDCRFFTLLGVAGTLLGSVLCFVEGCFTVLESYIHYFYLMSQKADQGHVIQLLIESLDMFLIGMAMLIFGVSLYAMFIGLKKRKLDAMTNVGAWVEVESVSHAKSKIGHAVMIILQVGVVDKFKSVPLQSGLDLACFSVALLFCSASILVLSKLSSGRAARQADPN